MAVSTNNVDCELWNTMIIDITLIVKLSKIRRRNILCTCGFCILLLFILLFKDSNTPRENMENVIM